MNNYAFSININSNMSETISSNNKEIFSKKDKSVPLG